MFTIISITMTSRLI